MTTLFNIPQNKFDDTAQVESMVNEILAKFSKKPDRILASCDCIKYGKETCAKVLQLFKDKGYFCYYLERFDGVWIELQIWKEEHQPRNSGLNKLYRF